MTTEAKKMRAEHAKFIKAAFIIKAVAHPKRLAIIEYLHQNGKTAVGDIVAELDCEQSCISHHLIGMKLKGILDCEKEGQFVYYWLKQPEVVQLLACVSGV